MNYIKIDQHDFDSYSYYIERVKDWIDNSIPVYYYYNMPINERYNLLDKDIILASYNENKMISKNDNVWIFNPSLGNCYQFNTNSKFKVENYKENKFELQLFYMDYYKISDIIGKTCNNLQENFFYIFVSGKKSNPFKEQKNLFKISIQDKEVEIKITKSIFNKQKKPYSNCDFVEDDDDGNFVYPSLFERKYYDQIE